MLRWRVLGTARFGDSFVPLIRAAGPRVVTVASRSAERVRECAARWEVERWSASYEALLADPEIDVGVALGRVDRAGARDGSGGDRRRASGGARAAAATLRAR